VAALGAVGTTVRSASTVYQHLRDGILRFVDCSSDHAAIARRVAQYVRECDVFVQGFRLGIICPSRLWTGGAQPHQSPRLIYVEVNAYDFLGAAVPRLGLARRRGPQTLYRCDTAGSVCRHSTAPCPCPG